MLATIGLEQQNLVLQLPIEIHCFLTSRIKSYSVH